MTLYEIDQALISLMESIDPETGEWTGDVEAWESLQMERDDKIDSTACYVKDLGKDIAGIKAEIRNLQQRVKGLENKRDWLLENLRRSLDGEAFESSRCQIKWKKNPESVKIEDKEAAMRWAEIYAPDAIKYAEPELIKQDLKTILKNGVDVPGCVLAQETRMEVK